MMSQLGFIMCNQTSSVGGSEVLWIRAARESLKSGHHCEVVVPECFAKNAVLDELKTLGAVVHVYRSMRTLSESIASRLFKLDVNPRALKFQRRPSLVVISQATCLDGIEWGERCLEQSIPFALISQAVREHQWPHDDLADRARNVMAAARQNFFVSHDNYKLFCSQVGAQVEPYAIISNPFQIKHDFRPAMPLSETYNLAILARLEPMDKGQDLLLRAVESDEWKHRDFRFNFYGKGSAERSLMRLGQMVGLADKICFHGHVEDVSDVLSKNHAVVLPSRSEGFSLSLIESSLAGRMVIATNVGDASRLITDGETGFICEVNVKSMRAALERAWQARSEWHEIGQRLATRARTVCSPDPVGDFCKMIWKL